MSIVRYQHPLGVCRIVIGKNNTTRLISQLRKHCTRGRLFVFYDAQCYALYGKGLTRHLRKAAAEVEPFVIPTGERSKSGRVLNIIYGYLLEKKISRTDFILAVGGGVTTDLTGYAAATILRGVRWAAVPTTLLGMVDAAIGGKTAVNHPRGKNLIGAYWHPEFVHVDVAFLQTLPERHLVSGLGEVVKYGGLVGREFTTPLEQYVNGGDLYDERMLIRLAKASASCKARIVEADERDGKQRRLLNLGHTFGHAIEKAAGYGRLLHGEAVMLGLAAAVELSGLTYGKTTPALQGYRTLVWKSIQLIPKRRFSIDTAEEAMGLDKKRRGADLIYVLLRRPGRPLIASGIDRAASHEALRRTLEEYNS